MIGSSTGAQFETEFDYENRSPITAKKDQSKAPTGEPQRPNWLPSQEPVAPPPGYFSRQSEIDRDHHVPLVASAIIDENGDMQGMAVDHRIPAKSEYDKHLWDHEWHETEYMKHLLKIGYTEQDAYHKAHDWSTQRESAAVEAEFGKDGLDAYKQHWRDAAAIASEPTDRTRHPDAHTTRYGLDESELGKQYAMNDNIRSDETPFQKMEESHGIQHPTIKPLTPLGTKIPGVTLKLPTGGGKPPETIYSAAIQHPDGEVHLGITHADAINRLPTGKSDQLFSLPNEEFEKSQGFVTSTGRFVSRKEALEIADKAKQIPPENERDRYTKKYHKTLGLISEDLDKPYVEEPLQGANQNTAEIKQFPVDETTKQFNIDHPSEKTKRALELREKYPDIYKNMDAIRGDLRKTEFEWAKAQRAEKQFDEKYRNLLGMSVEDFKYWKAFLKQNPDYFNK